jgi:hypothetical protein
MKSRLLQRRTFQNAAYRRFGFGVHFSVVTLGNVTLVADEGAHDRIFVCGPPPRWSVHKTDFGAATRGLVPSINGVEGRHERCRTVLFAPQVITF